MAPQIVWVSPTYQFALRHETIRISCIFSGRYFPSIFKLFFILVPGIFIYLFIFVLQYIFSRSTTFLRAIGEFKPFALGEMQPNRNRSLAECMAKYQNSTYHFVYLNAYYLLPQGAKTIMQVNIVQENNIS